MATAGELYTRDFYTWTQDQAARLRALTGDNRIDAVHLAEEVADLGRSELNKVAGNLTHLLAHLIKAAWLGDTADAAGHWRKEVVAFQKNARRAYSPGMRQHLDVAGLWSDALDLAVADFEDMGVPVPADRPACPVTLDALLAVRFDRDAALTAVVRALGGAEAP